MALVSRSLYVERVAQWCQDSRARGQLGPWRDICSRHELKKGKSIDQNSLEKPHFDKVCVLSGSYNLKKDNLEEYDIPS